MSDNAPEVFALATKSAGNVGLLVRKTSGGSATQTNAGSPKYPNAWLRLRRVGNTFTANYGSDGSHWAALASSVTVPVTGVRTPLVVKAIRGAMPPQRSRCQPIPGVVVVGGGELHPRKKNPVVVVILNRGAPAPL